MLPVFLLKLSELGLCDAEMRGREGLPFLFAVAIEARILAAIRMTHQIIQPRLFPIFGAASVFISAP